MPCISLGLRGLSAPQIPACLTLLTSLRSWAVPDRSWHFARTLVAGASSTVAVPVDLSYSNGLMGFNVALAYDTNH